MRNFFYLLYYLVWLLLFLILAFKQPGDPDYDSYREIFIYSDSTFNRLIEPGYNYINHFFRVNEFAYALVLFSAAILLIVPKMWFITRYSTNKWLSLIIYISTLYIHYDFIAVRQGIALSFIFVSFYFLIDTKPLGFIIMILIASLFHISSIIVLPSYFICRWASNLYVVSVGLAIFILLAISKVSLIPTDQIALILGFSSFVSTKLSNYATPSDFVLSSKDILLYMLVAASLYKNKYLSNYQSVTLGLVSCGLIVSIISIDIPMLFFRIRSYFTSFEIIAIPLSIQMLFAKSRYRALLMLILYSLFSFVYSYSAISFIGSIYDRGFHYYFFHLL